MSLLEVGWPFLKLGVTAFGGPAAHIAMMEEEFVVRRRWLERQHFLDLVGATNLIPGPNSTEMALHIGYERAGLPGLLVAGAAFLLPAITMTSGLAWVYARYGALPQAEPWLEGIKPAVLAIIAGALWKLGRQAVTTRPLALLGLLVVAANLAGLDEILALAAGAALGTLLLAHLPRPQSAGIWLTTLVLLHPRKALAAGATPSLARPDTWQLFGVFLKIGSILYGSGYVLIAFLQGELVQQRGWLTQAQLLDAVAMGQLTPGPILSTATFIGYTLAGPLGALAATVGIFLPSFLLVLALQRALRSLGGSPAVRRFLDAVNVAALALMLSVLLQLSVQVAARPAGALLAALALVVHLRLKLSGPWLVVGGAAAGWLLSVCF
jgi:chromate transporter